MTQKHFLFDNYVLNTAQLHETAHQLHYTIAEFQHDNVDRDYLIGKLRFFIDMYWYASNELHINETVVLDNYFQFLRALSPKLDNEDELQCYWSDLMNDYLARFLDKLDEILDYIDKNTILDVDEVLDYVSGLKEFNFQEHQFIMDIYYSTCGNFKLMQLNGSYETDYYFARSSAAIYDYCKEHDCQPSDVLVRAMYEDEDVLSARQFYVYLLHVYEINLDFIMDYDDRAMTVKQWVEFITTTLEDVNKDLSYEFDKDIIDSNNDIISKLSKVI